MRTAASRHNSPTIDNKRARRLSGTLVHQRKSPATMAQRLFSDVYGDGEVRERRFLQRVTSRGVAEIAERHGPL
jgi:hypothetical protein